MTQNEPQSLKNSKHLVNVINTAKKDFNKSHVMCGDSSNNTSLVTVTKMMHSC